MNMRDSSVRLLHRDLFRLQCFEDEVGGHQLGERRRFHALVSIAGREHLVAGGVDEHPRTRVHRRRRNLRERAAGGEGRRQHEAEGDGAAQLDGNEGSN